MFFSKVGTDSNTVLKALDEIEKYISNDINELKVEAHVSDPNITKISSKILSLANHLQKKQDQDLEVFGEVMLVCEKLSDGFIDDRISQKTEDEKINYVAYSINKAMDNLSVSLEEVIKVLGEYENNDYTSSVNVSLFRGGQFKQLLEGINKLQQGITTRVLQSYKIGLTMEHQADILQTEVNKLSESTAQQAAAIEQTAAAIEEITQSINLNTESTINMLDSGKILQDSAKKSITLANGTTEAMNNIDQSTQDVYNAITVISQIAFQTNILSLNAAVEAATAGEAGKGFAVVAGEVRNLANRSADAARTIEGLMDELKTQTEAGKVSSVAMDTEFNLLNQHIEETMSSLDQIATASKEQKDGIAQINMSIQHIDAATQSNASATQRVNDIAIQTHNVANTLANSNRDVNFEGKAATETPDEIIKSLFSKEKLF
jgi:methyl-accepting chemotaxis protein